MKSFHDFCDNETLNDVMRDYVQSSIDYEMRTSVIMSFYHTFEQYIKIEYKVGYQKGLTFMNELKNKCLDYDYDTEQNTYYDVVEKYRKLNNTIKHGRIIKSYEKDLSEFIVSNDDMGTLMNDPLDITDENIEECYVSLCEFVQEMYCYFEDMEYIND